MVCNLFKKIVGDFLDFFLLLFGKFNFLEYEFLVVIFEALLAIMEPPHLPF